MTDSYEVELKIRTSHDAVRGELAERGADRIEVVEQTDTYYDAPDRDFAETDEALRIRRERVLAGGDASTATTNGEAIDASPDTTNSEGTETSGDTELTNERVKITYKGPLVDAESKTRLEAETTVGDQEATRAIFEGLGYEPAATVEKHRERFDVAGFTVTLDTVSDLGTFVEIDRETTADELDAVREEAKRILRELGLDPDEGIRTSYLGMLLADET